MWSVRVMVHAEILYPYLTGIVLFLAGAFVLYVYKRISHRALLLLGAGLFSVGLESILDGYEAYQLLSISGGSWNNLPQEHLTGMLALDAVRGFFIVIWAAMEVLFTVEVVGSQKKLWRFYVPALIIVAGFLETILLNFSSITPLDTRILISSAGRVLGELVPVALVAGVYLLKVYREVGSKSTLYFGVAFIVHGVTLPAYSLAKEAGALTLGLWYLFGGVVPGLLAMAGAYYLWKESEVAAK